MVRVYREKYFNVYSGDNSFIIHNTKKEFQQGHTHVRNFKTCKYIIALAIHKSIPHCTSMRIIDSIMRITDDEVYKNKLQKYKLNKKKKIPYINKR